MKHCAFFTALFLLSVLAAGCDDVRALLGKPTSADIELARQTRIRIEQARLDSIEQVKVEAELQAARQRELDSLAALDSLTSSAYVQADAIRRYNVIVGTFQNVANAENMVKELAVLGEKGTLIRMSSGMTAISVLNTDDYNQAVWKVKAVNNIDALPFNCWIYDSITGKHK